MVVIIDIVSLDVCTRNDRHRKWEFQQGNKEYANSAESCDFPKAI